MGRDTVTSTEVESKLALLVSPLTSNDFQILASAEGPNGLSEPSFNAA